MRILATTILALLFILAVHPDVTGAGELHPIKGTVKAGDFIIPDLEGRAMRFSALQGKVVLLNFWATWCPPCRKEMPSMEQLHREYNERGLVVLALSQDQAGARSVQAYVDALRITFPVWHDRDRLVSRQYSIPGVPTSYLISRDGRIAYRAFGEFDWAMPKARAIVETLLDARTPQ